MTDAELQGIAAQALNIAKHDIEQGDFNFVLATYHHGEGLHRMSKIEALLIERLGEEWLNSGPRKDAGFALLHLAVAMRPPDATVLVTASNGFAPTAKLAALPKEQQRALLDGGHKGHHEAVREGLLEMFDMLHATAQTAERVCLYAQQVPFSSPPEVHFYPQAQFKGRLKFYGVDPIESLAILKSYGLRPGVTQ